MTESMADFFPEATLVNIAVAPYHFSEVVVQHYNSLLCLSKLLSAVHGVFIFENEVAQDLCRSMRRINRPTLDDINQTMSSNILPVLLPKFRGGGPCQRHSCLSNDIADLCPHPQYKFLDVKHTPQTADASVEFTFDSWSALLKNIEYMQAAGTASETHASRQRFGANKPANYVNMSSLLILRGLGASEAASECITSMRSSRSIRHAVWSDTGDYYSVCTSPFYVNGYQRSMTLVSNGQTIVPYLQRLLMKATEMFRVGAYLHQYTAVNGDLQVDDFVDSFRSLGQTLQDYRSLGS